MGKSLNSFLFVIRENVRGCGGIGRRAGFKIQFSQESMGSSPIIPTLIAYSASFCEAFLFFDAVPTLQGLDRALWLQ